MKFGFREPADLIKFLAERMQYVGHYVELGVFQGYTFNQVAPLCELATAVDIAAVGRHLNFGEFHQMTSADFLVNVLPGLPDIDLALIDADHSFESSLADFLGLLPRVKIDGLVCLHDTFPAGPEYTDAANCGDSYRTAAYLREHAGPLGIEVVTLPIPHGMTIARRWTQTKLT